MIYPTRATILLAILGAPAGLLLGLLAPGLWLAAASWIVIVLSLALLDALLCASGRSVETELVAPGVLPVGGTGEAVVTTSFFGRMKPRAVETALGAEGKLTVDAPFQRRTLSDGEAILRFSLSTERRGSGAIDRLWLRWKGPLGLIWRQRVETPNHAIAITPDIASVREEALRLFSRDASFGLKIQRDAGAGGEYHALRDFQPGMELRAIDWKQSARHRALLVKEFRAERNHQIVFAVDCGRAMSEPIARLSRLDRALNAALLLAFVSLKLGDRAGLFAFDSKVRIDGGPVTGLRGFAALQKLAARVDYSAEETNFTLALSALAAKLERRSLIVIFTDFPDTISAELMIENVGRLLQRHLVVFVAMRDEELESLVLAEPKDAADVSRAVTAGVLLREREQVLLRLRRLGVQVVDAPLAQVGSRLVNAYLDLKRRSLL